MDLDTYVITPNSLFPFVCVSIDKYTIKSQSDGNGGVGKKKKFKDFKYGMGSDTVSTKQLRVSEMSSLTTRVCFTNIH